MGSGLAGVICHCVSCGAAFEERVAVGIEQRAAVGRQAHGFVIDARMDGAERGEQATPGIVAAFENFFAVLVGAFAEQLAQGGDGVVLVVKRVAEQEQSAFFGGEQEDEPHHDGERAVVEPFRSRRRASVRPDSASMRSNACTSISTARRT